MLTCHDVADYFLALQDEDSGDTISNLKLQKLVYYAQGVYLALYDKPLFAERMEAWTHGPVVPDLYHRFKEYGSEAIPADQHFNLEKFDSDSREILDEVNRVFGQYSGWKLRNMTHEEPPWVNVKEPAGVISHESLKEYFKTIVTK
ncbi:MAG: type II toxin-antitoxin system antitoxin SocA domain-containing protein [Sideroxyarcus sp.]